MSDAGTVEALQAQLAERERELARLRAELGARELPGCTSIEEQLRESEARADDLIRFAPTGIYEVDFRTGHLRSVNDALCRFLGYSRDELLALSGFDLLDGAGKELFAERIRRGQAGEKVDPTVEYRVKRKDGSLIYAVLSTRIIYRDGQADGAFVIAHDITERRHVMAELEAILAAIPEGLIVVDAEGRVVRSNATAQQMLGLWRNSAA